MKNALKVHYFFPNICIYQEKVLPLQAEIKQGIKI